MIEYILNSENNTKILRFLFERPDWIFSQSEIARELKIPKTTAQRALKTLSEQNILREIKKKGKINIYQLNKKNYIVRDLLESLFKKERMIVIEKSRQFVRNIMKYANFQNAVKAVILFGSAARGEMEPTSDVDLLIIIKDNINRLEKLILMDAIEKTKNEFLDKDGIIFSTQYLDDSDFKKKFGELKDPFVKNICIDGTFVYGDIERFCE